MASGPGAARENGNGRSGRTATTPSWQAPTDIEQSLYEAKLRSDWSAYLDVVAATPLYHAMPRSVAEADMGRVRWTPSRNPFTGVRALAFFTPGVLPAPTPDLVFFSGGLEELAQEWAWTGCALAIDPGTPCEAYFPTTPAHRAVWQQHARRAPEHRGGVLRTLRVGGPLEGPVAHGLACGALLCVNNGSLWNAMGWHGTGYQSEWKRLRDWWGITDRDQWERTLEDLLMGRVSNPVWEFVLQTRQSLAREQDGPVEQARWRQITERLMRRRAAETAGAGAGADPAAPDADLAAEIDRVQQLISRITRYEARFRADGLLPEGGYVRSVLAWDYGRASKMARWGLGARHCTLAEAEHAVVRAGRISQVTYGSWEEFSAGYVLGRCLHFDEESFGPWYEEMLGAHRILTSDPESPWRTVPWR